MVPRTPAAIKAAFSFCVELVDGVVVVGAGLSEVDASANAVTVIAGTDDDRSAYTGDNSEIRVNSPKGTFWASMTLTRSCKQSSDLGNLTNWRTLELPVIPAPWVHPEPLFVSTVKSTGTPSS